MKTIQLTLLMILSSVIVSYSQINYYSGKTIVEGETVTYRCKSSRFECRIANINNVYNDGYSLTLKDGTLAPRVPSSYSTINDLSKVHQAFRAVFSESELTQLKSMDASILIWMILNSNGTIKELKLVFSNKPPFNNISPDRYYQLEQKLKQNVSYTLEANMWDYYQFVSTNIRVEFKDL